MIKNFILGCFSNRKKLEVTKEQIKSKNIIWHVCTPKSASTYFMNYCRTYLSNASDGKIYDFVSSVPEYKDRPQVICTYTLLDRIKKSSKGATIVTKHQHVLPTEDLLSVISQNHKVIVQTRSVTDTLVSMLDHINQDSEKNGPWLMHSREYWGSISQERKMDWLIAVYVPWHVNFLSGWLNIKNRFGNIYFYEYQELTTFTPKVFKEIFSFDPETNTESFIPTKSNSRLNKAVAGRGQSVLDARQIENVEKMLIEGDFFNHNLLKYL